MIKSNNTIVLCGNVVEVPTLRKAGEVDVTTVRLAVNNTEKDTLFIDCECWRNDAIFATKFFKKGSSISVVGGLRSREYDNKDGVKVRVFFVEAANVMFTGSKKEEGDEAAPKAETKTAEKPKTTAKPAAKPSYSGNEGLPF